ncbi:NADH dehydrogenase [ubiquinone] 1 alpha subcomplex assembly factor 2 isoform X1 [Vitis riparia]|uniref:NADH dehydrogenase [ubiquinone] 1 alpha subcomplex assembly factor 2 isoform X1 n=1 Tax=Vitis riparia TaxID=96939 RepID=UPI00155AE697|nr:NADH dehydrogenase [ubiquinone] 1 alpha subcomplex assembly factor 2 isoform X1 [Vitis riparia]
MSKLLSRIAGFFSSRTMVGADKVGNRYFIRKEEVDGIMKEKRWVVFKGEKDPTSIPVEWICWLNGQRKVAPTPEEMIELEARRERVRLNVALLKEEEERKAKEGSTRKVVKTGKVGGPDLKSFIRQFPATSEGDKMEEASDAVDDMRNPKETDTAEPTGTGASFKPGTWQPPT